MGFVDAVCAALPGCRVVSPARSELLNASFCADSVSVCLAHRADVLCAATLRLAQVNRHEAFSKLKASLRHPRVMYDLHAGPCFSVPRALRCFVLAFDSAIKAVACVRLDQETWGRASVLASSGGLGIRATSNPALPAFLFCVSASAVLSDALCSNVPDSAF